MTTPPSQTEVPLYRNAGKSNGQRNLQIDIDSNEVAGSAPGSVFCGKPDDETDSTDTPGSPGQLVEGVLVEQPEDGSCLFHSIAYGVGKGCEAKGLRKEVASFIELQSKSSISGTSIEEWVTMTEGTSPQEYAKDLLNPFTWGGALEIAIAAKIKSVNINVYEASSNGKFKLISTFTEPSAQRTVDVVYRTKPSKHYDALRDKR